jgi:hypothetical protein
MAEEGEALIEFGRTLYFYIRGSDLRRGDFSRAWYDSD